MFYVVEKEIAVPIAPITYSIKNIYASHTNYNNNNSPGENPRSLIQLPKSQLKVQNDNNNNKKDMTTDYRSVLQ